MIGGSIPGETKTIGIALYDRVQAFDLTGANRMALLLLVLSFGAVGASPARGQPRCRPCTSWRDVAFRPLLALLFPLQPVASKQ